MMKTMRQSDDFRLFGWHNDMAEQTTCYTVCPSYDLAYDEAECGEDVSSVIYSNPH